MIALRVVLSAGMVVLGASILIRMLPYGLPGLTGTILGAAMIALGIFRLNQLRAIWSRR